MNEYYLGENPVVTIGGAILIFCIAIAIVLVITKSIWRWVFDVDYQIELLRDIRNMLKEQQQSSDDSNEKEGH